MATKKTTPKTTAKAAAKPVAKLAAKTTLKAETAKKPAPAATVAAPPLLPEAKQPVEAAAANKETMEAAVKAGTQAATKSYEQAVAMAQEQVEKASSSLFQGYDDAASLGQETVDAYLRSTSVFAKGFEALGKELMAFAQNAVEVNAANTQALFGAKTVLELFELQNEISSSGYDSLVTESAKLTELSMALANDTAEPLQTQLTATVEKLMKPLAA